MILWNSPTTDRICWAQSEAMWKVAISEAEIIFWRTHCILLSCQPIDFCVSLNVVLWLSSKYHIPPSAWYLKPPGLTPPPSIMLHCFTRNVTSLAVDVFIPRKLFFYILLYGFLKYIYPRHRRCNLETTELIQTANRFIHTAPFSQDEFILNI